MNTSEVLSYADLLEDNLDALEDSLNELLPQDSLAEASKKLPLLDRAKLHITIVYAIETYLRLHNVSPHSHPVFKELTRVKSYFDKIKEIEANPPGQKRDLALDKQAANRMIKHALSSNTKIDLEAAEKKAREALLAKRKLKTLEKKMSLTDSEPMTPVPSSDPVPPPESLLVAAAREAAEGSEEGEIADGEVEEGEVDETEVVPEVVTPVRTKKQIKKERKRQREAEAAAAMGQTPKTKKKRKHSSLPGGT